MRVDNEISLTGFLPADQELLVRFLNDRGIQDNTLRLPYPYTEGHAQKWIDHCRQEWEGQQARQFAIRHSRKGLIGAIGFSVLPGEFPHKEEFGYWVAPDYWGKGIATKVVSRFVGYGFNEFGLKRLEAFVFPENYPSCRVLEKNNFRCEGLLRYYQLKHDRFHDTRIYAKISSDR